MPLKQTTNARCDAFKEVARAGINEQPSIDAKHSTCHDRRITIPMNEQPDAQARCENVDGNPLNRSVLYSFCGTSDLVTLALAHGFSQVCSRLCDCQIQFIPIHNWRSC